MNREEKRAYRRQHKNDPQARYCATCGFKTIKYAIPIHEGSKKCLIVCEVCQKHESYIPTTEFEPYQIASTYRPKRRSIEWTLTK